MRHTPPFRYPPELPTPRGPDYPLLAGLALIVILVISFAALCVVKSLRKAPVTTPVAVSAEVSV